jgi:hypothetical protein
MTLYSYVIARDYGFAPNPFYSYCTLATCKPIIRKKAQIGDWIIGTGSVAKNLKNHLVYAMQVEEKLLFDDYWNDSRFFNKRPVMNGSKKQCYGDNIYHKVPNSNKYIQENSHHSLEDGSINIKNYKRDISGKYVLISKKYWYFGEKAILLPKTFLGIVKERQGYIKTSDESLINKLFLLLLKQEESGYIGRPYDFAGNFKRFKGD